ncbi:MAG TPA: amino acid permease [Pyrinomonadaceae bacterium]|jgi:APA family basic amino acid/polyamine antiporter
MAENLSSKVTLLRGLGLVAAISIIIGNVIGTGVFLKARVMTCNVGDPVWVIIVWIAAGILSLAGALTYAELSAMKPEAGGEYVFLRDAYGRVSSFLYGWMLIFVGKTGAQAAVAVTFAIGLNDFFGGKLKQTIVNTNVFGYQLEITSLQIVGIMLIVIFTTINCASVVLSGKIATVLTFVKVALIAFVGIGAFVWVTGGTFEHLSMISDGGKCEGVADSVRYGSANYSFVAGFGAAMLGALWGYDGWNNLSLVAGEIKNPGKNIPIALIGGTIVIMILYVFVHFAYFHVLDPTSIASVSKDSSVAREVVSKFFSGNIASYASGVCVSIFTIGLMLSSIGTLHTSILTGARVPYAMAKDGLMFEPMGRLSSGTRVPVIALIVQGVWACVLALSGSFDTLTDYVIFGSWIFYALVTSSIFVFRRKYPDLNRPYKAFGYPVVPILFLLVAAFLLINTMINAPFQAFTGIILILIGLPVYYYLTSRNRGETIEE